MIDSYAEGLSLAYEDHPVIEELSLAQDTNMLLLDEITHCPYGIPVKCLQAVVQTSTSPG